MRNRKKIPKFRSTYFDTDTLCCRSQEKLTMKNQVDKRVFCRYTEPTVKDVEGKKDQVPLFREPAAAVSR